MNKRLYLAYGSNMNRDQMGFRCRDARLVAKGFLNGYELNFCRNLNSGCYATVVEKPGAKTPILLWSTSEIDELCLDRYEGYPRFYRKERVPADKLTLTKRYCKRKITDAYIYIMNSTRYGVPSTNYYTCISDAYDEFGFDENYLIDAYRRAYSN